jgi:hypothetical protein
MINDLWKRTCKKDRMFNAEKLCDGSRDNRHSSDCIPGTREGEWQEWDDEGVPCEAVDLNNRCLECRLISCMYHLHLIRSTLPAVNSSLTPVLD